MACRMSQNFTLYFPPNLPETRPVPRRVPPVLMGTGPQDLAADPALSFQHGSFWR